MKSSNSLENKKRVQINNISYKLFANLFLLVIITYLLYIKYIKDELNFFKENEIREAKNYIINLDNSSNKCYHSLENQNKAIIHLILTRFLITFFHINGFPGKLEKEDYILNGIRVMEKYLFPSLERQNCKAFVWVLILGNQANITKVKTFLNFDNSFPKIIIKQKDFKNFIRRISKGFDILITTRYDYDDRIYYDAVNDVRKTINFDKPILLHGYNRGFIYFESNNKYYIYEQLYKGLGVHSIFISLIIILSKVNDAYTVYDLGNHVHIKRNLLNNYKSYGIQELKYNPAIFENGSPKFVWVRQNYSGYFNLNIHYEKNEIFFNLSKFYGQ